MSKYKKDYDPAFSDELLRIASKGGSILNFAAKIMVTLSNIGEWANEHEEFRDAIEIAKYSEIKYWEDRYSEAVIEHEKDLATMAQFALKQRYDLFRDVYKKTDPTNINPQSAIISKALAGFSEFDRNEDVLDG